MSGKRLIVLLLFVAVVGTVTTAYLRGWFIVSSHRSSETGGDVDVRLTTDRAKLEEDAAKVRKKSADLVGGGHDDENVEKTSDSTLPAKR